MKNCWDWLVTNLDYIPYGKQWLDEDDVAAVSETLNSDWLTTGPKVKELEELLAAKVGTKYAVALNSGTAALHAAYFVAGIGPGDEVITSPITFAATANAALYLGAKPVFVDVNYDTGNIDAQQIEKAITKKTKVIAPVDFTGQPTDLNDIIDIAKRHNLIVVEDAAHALGATYKSRIIGSIADMTIFSFHPVKHITTGEGGAVATDNPDYYKKLVMFRTHGIVKDDQMLEKHGPWYYEIQGLGYNYRITDFQCALGISQLKKLDKFVALRKRIAEEYSKKLAHLSDFLELPVQNIEADSSWHLYVVKVKSGQTERRKLFDYLHSKQIGVQVHYIPVYWHPYYQNLGYQRGLCPEAEKFYTTAISLPMFPKMDKLDVDRVCSELSLYYEVGRSE